MTARSALGWLGALTLVRLLVAWRMPVTPDEAYYRVWSHALAGGYPDHPPMVALWIAAGRWLAGDTALGIRLLGPLAVAAGSLLVVGAARDIMPTTTGGQGPVRAAALLNATLALGVGGVVMTPDSPLLFFLCLALFALGRLLATGRGAWWLLAGGAFGAAFESKYTAVLPVAGVGVWLLACARGRRWLVTPWVWLGGLAGAIVCVPVVLWNARNDWVSFLRQGGRVGVFKPERAVQFLGELIGGQIGLATPLVFVLFVLGGIQLWRMARRDGGAALLAAMIGVPTAVFVFHALGDRVQANWPVLIYPFLALPAGYAAAGSVGWARRLWRPASVCGVAMAGAVYGQGLWSILPLSPHHDVVLRQTGGWPALARSVEAARRPDEVVLADEYGLASELALYGVSGVVAGPDPRWRTFALPHPAATQALLVRSERRRDALPQGVGPGEDAGEIARVQAGKQIDRYRLYHVRIEADPARGPLMSEIPAAR
ncbi:glycosyl/arabinosyl/mannosyl transferase [Ameyamaea chiangmaiensis NBRC 103196]|uniref:glycosyltransferase family 39 protein n=1 Tax=Ameyamaea chiangmaiensis TaxID=442969 RepID=UPI002156BB19|nr:glycosyltransferase family 39 protein [Ameyamaea chiangmaiensis]GBQ72218.1 glycosyl/arabinosyl/mannosyl transferase [Ameyamaea chiangmaiensis NBRC 103196]